MHSRTCLKKDFYKTPFCCVIIGCVILFADSVKFTLNFVSNFTKNTCQNGILRVFQYSNSFLLCCLYLIICYRLNFQCADTIVPPKASNGILQTKNKRPPVLVRVPGVFLYSFLFLVSGAVPCLQARLRSCLPSFSRSSNCSQKS